MPVLRNLHASAAYYRISWPRRGTRPSAITGRLRKRCSARNFFEEQRRRLPREIPTRRNEKPGLSILTIASSSSLLAALRSTWGARSKFRAVSPLRALLLRHMPLQRRQALPRLLFVDRRRHPPDRAECVPQNLGLGLILGRAAFTRDRRSRTLPSNVLDGPQPRTPRLPANFAALNRTEPRREPRVATPRDSIGAPVTLQGSIRIAAHNYSGDRLYPDLKT